ncbi:putative rho GTPase-activating protein 7 [Apostichopus japonicus]|uniref:Putative rho GTPase-activating protein 7 n=1 Tax=Stichopus japonicus TaxID=307972 RepID=A0A2G8JW36_STIJA|nr:putative rho GTPase-activating protein 7 [Apostichopus japonicus]
MDLINSPSGHRERIPSFYDNFPHTLHSSLDNVPTGSSEQEDSESELMREIYNLKNLGHLNANDLSYRELEEDTSGPAELLLSEKYGDYKKADERPRRGRSNSLPISPSDILGEAGDGLEEVEPTEGKQEMMGLHDELERILDGINESISEIQGQINRNSSLSSESQVSSPAGSHLSTPFNSPVPSPLSSPNLDSARHHQDSDTGLGSLSPPLWIIQTKKMKKIRIEKWRQVSLEGEEGLRGGQFSHQTKWGQKTTYPLAQLSKVAPTKSKFKTFPNQQSLCQPVDDSKEAIPVEAHCTHGEVLCLSSQRLELVSLLRGLASQELCFRLTSQVLTSLQLGGPESIDVIVECLLLGFIKAKFDVIIWVARLSQSVVCLTHKQLRK